jgi:hypothetical protein
MDYFESKRRNDLVRQREAEGGVADSMEVRRALIERMHAGELTLAQVQAELAGIKRKAKSNGQVTRAQAWRGR